MKDENCCLTFEEEVLILWLRTLTPQKQAALSDLLDGKLSLASSEFWSLRTEFEHLFEIPRAPSHEDTLLKLA